MPRAREPESAEPIYLDHAAATPLRPEAEAAMRDATAKGFANASSPHAAGRQARRILEESRERILTALGGRSTGVDRDRLVFTSGATEANRLGVLGREDGPGTIAWSPRDHASIQAAAAELAVRGWHPVPLAANQRGSVIEAVLALADSPPGRTVVCLTTVCGQTGILDPAVTTLAATPLVSIHVDHTQATAWDATPLDRLAATTVALAPHKFGGPRGIGGLVVRGGVRLRPVQPGPQELGLRGGTESVPLAAAFAAALEAAVAERSAAVDHVTALRQRFECGVTAAAAGVGRRVVVIGDHAPRAPHITTIAVEGFDRQTLVMAADLAGVFLATGTACASGSSEPSPAILSLHEPPWVARSAFRASFAPASTCRDVDAAVSRLTMVFRGIAGGGLHLGSSPE
ncbi:MAG: cysteine desulfurase family protein [Planctomycetota bacterium]